MSEAVWIRGQPHRAEKRYWYGTQRSIPPAETLERVRPYFARAGLTRLANITGLDRLGIPTVVAVRPNASYLAVDAGKGFTTEAATVSAAMESIERYCAEAVRLPEVRASHEERAAAGAVVALDRLLLAKHAVFTPKSIESWVFGWDICHQREVAVPSICVAMAARRLDRADLMSFQNTSNGLASGNNLAEAITAALLEVVERDAVACHRVASERHGRPMRRFGVESVTDPLVGDLLDRLAAAGLSATVLDCTVDTAIPVYLAYVHDQRLRHVGIYRGYGAHLDPAIAMARAITEAVQSRVVFIAGARDDLFSHDYTRLKQTDNEEMVASLERMACVADARALVSSATPTFEGDIAVIRERLEAVGLDEIIVFDLTPPDFPVAIVRVVVPGLEGYVTDCYAPGVRARTFSRSVG
jgi:YcaO-like protein with predicted kinase domain